MNTLEGREARAEKVYHLVEDGVRQDVGFDEGFRIDVVDSLHQLENWEYKKTEVRFGCYSGSSDSSLMQQQHL